MNISTDGINNLQRFEGLSLKPYRDSGGLWTIGFGHLIKPGEDHLFNGITEDQAHKIFVEDVVPSVVRVNKFIKADISQPQFDALVSWDFNTGRIHNTTLTTLINSGAPLKDIFKFWVSNYITASGKPAPGLITRRNIEASQFTGIKQTPGASASGSGFFVAVAAVGLLWFINQKRH